MSTRRIAFYGGSFDPVHNGHLGVAIAVSEQFELSEFVFIPAFHAPHKRRTQPTSAFHRFAMLCAATDSMRDTKVSTIEIESPEMPYTIETIGRLKKKYPQDRLYIVIGADSWEEITTWKEWERILTDIDVVVVTRPGYDIGLGHVTDKVRLRIIDLRNGGADQFDFEKNGIFLTDAVNSDVSATNIRKMIREGRKSWKEVVDSNVAHHICKYELYL